MVGVTGNEHPLQSTFGKRVFPRLGKVRLAGTAGYAAAGAGDRTETAAELVPQMIEVRLTAPPPPAR